MIKLTMDSVIEELNGIVVLGTNGQEIDLTGITYLEFAVMLDELFQGEANQLLNAIVDKIGEEELTKISYLIGDVVVEGEYDVPTEKSFPMMKQIITIPYEIVIE